VTVLPVHKLPDDREAALQPGCRADAAGEVQILSLEDDAGIAGHLHGDAALWGKERVPRWGLYGLPGAPPHGCHRKRGANGTVFGDSELRE
jgi:hypothetical protein